MKKFILAAFAAVATLSANAQIWAGGSLGFGVTSPDKGESTTTYTIAPEVGYSLNDKWDIALEIGLAGSSTDGNTSTNFSIEPFARYKFAELGKVKFFADGLVGFGSIETKVNDVKVSQDMFRIGVRPGIAYALTDKLSIDSTIGWFGYKNVKDSYNQFGLELSNALSFGLYYEF